LADFYCRRQRMSLGKFAYTKTGYEGSRRTGRSMENRLAGNHEILVLTRI
jgi:hypothetical protein